MRIMWPPGWAGRTGNPREKSRPALAAPSVPVVAIKYTRERTDFLPCRNRTIVQADYSPSVHYRRDFPLTARRRSIILRLTSSRSRARAPVATEGVVEVAHIVVVDDYQEFAELVEEVLGESGYAV